MIDGPSGNVVSGVWCYGTLETGVDVRNWPQLPDYSSKKEENRAGSGNPGPDLTQSLESHLQFRVKVHELPPEALVEKKSCKRYE